MIIGVTGGMGTGKSYICSLLRDNGFVVYDSDSMAKVLLNENHLIKEAVINEHGMEMYSDGLWNKEHVAKLILEDNSIMDSIGKIVEPFMVQDLLKFSREHENVVFESALLGKSKALMDTVDKIIMVVAPLWKRMERIKQRDKDRTIEETLALLNNQSTGVIMKLCDVDLFVYNGDRPPVNYVIETINGWKL